MFSLSLSFHAWYVSGGFDQNLLRIREIGIIPRWEVDDLHPMIYTRSLQKEHGVKTHSNIKYLRDRHAVGAWLTKSRVLVAITDYKVPGKYHTNESDRK